MDSQEKAGYLAQIAELRAQLAASRSRMPQIRPMQSRGTSSVSSIVASQEMILEADASDIIRRTNRPFLQVLDLDEGQLLNRRLVEFDKHPLPEGIFAALAKAAREKPGEVFISEDACPGLAIARLPDAANLPSGISAVLEFSATATQSGRVQFVLRDVSRIKWLESTFSRYVSPTVIEELESHSQDDWLKMQRRDLSLLFCDLRGFTALTERIDPQTLQQMINGFLANMVEGVESLGGMVEQFAGDGLMAIFGAPLPQPDHALRAALTALEMQQRHRRWMTEQSQRGLPALHLGVGFASGPVVVGNIGTRQRLHYTALGHTTNLASRLCSIADPGEILTTKETWGRIEESWRQSPLPKLDVTADSRGIRQLKNVADAVAIVALAAKPAHS